MWDKPTKCEKDAQEMTLRASSIRGYYVWTN